MARCKVAVSLEKDTVRRLDELVRRAVFVRPWDGSTIAQAAFKPGNGITSHQ